MLFCINKSLKMIRRQGIPKKCKSKISAFIHAYVIKNLLIILLFYTNLKIFKFFYTTYILNRIFL